MPSASMIQYAKGHKYLTLVYQIDIGITRLLWVGKERTPLSRNSWNGPDCKHSERLYG
jgi:hypothetical protein